MEEYLADKELTAVQRRVVEFLLSRKGYGRDDMEVNKEFDVRLGDASFKVSADVVLTIEGMRFLTIICAVSSLDSWERFSTALCRVVDSYQIPYAVITDGDDAKVLDAVQGRLLSEGLDSIPARDEAVRIVRETTFCPHPEGKCEREKRILYAFDAIRCPANPPQSHE